MTGMTSARALYDRVLVHMPYDCASEGPVRLVANLASQLGLALVGTLPHDETVSRLAGGSGLRALSREGAGWAEVAAEQLTQDSRRTFEIVRQRFLGAAGNIDGTAKFLPAARLQQEASAASEKPRDIVAVIQPANPAERISYQFRHLLDVSLQGGQPLLLVPSSIVRAEGSILTIGLIEGSTGTALASALAQAGNDRVIPLTASSNSPVTSLRDIQHLALLAAVNERLFVVSSHCLTPDDLQAFVSRRGIPVLVVD